MPNETGTLFMSFGGTLLMAGDTGEEMGEYAQGFRSTGLWGLVRHPNYAAEQGTWVFFYLFSVAATGRWLNWSIVGVILLILLFLGSSDFSEKISAGKYPAYKEYQRRVPRFLPIKFGRKKEKVADVV